MKSFVRGGQLSLHSVRMLIQVCLATFKWSLVFYFILIVYVMFLKLDINSLYYSSIYYVAKLFTLINAENVELTFGGKTHKAYQWIGNYRYIKSYNQTYIKIIDSIKIASYVTAFTWVLIIFIFFKKGKDSHAKKEIRGKSLVEIDLLKTLTTNDNKKNKYIGYKLLGIQYPSFGETLHTMVVGSTGSGKTVLISDLVSQIKARGDRAIIYDKMGTYTEKFYDRKNDIILNPFDNRSRSWNLFKEVSHGANFDSIASALIPSEKGSIDPFWTKAARTIFAEVCSSLLTKGGVTNEKLVEMLLRKNLSEVSKLVKGTAAQAILDEQSPKTALSVMSVMSTYLKSLKYLKDDENSFSIKDWVINENVNSSIFITSKGDLHSALMPIISAWFEIAINNMLSLKQSRSRKIWIILDELPSLHYLPSLEQGLAETRQFGGCFVVGIQSVPQLRTRYGRDAAETISALCGNKVMLRNPDQDTARWCSDNIGHTEVEEYKEGLSYGAHQVRDGVSINKERTIRPLVLPTEIMNLKNLEGYLCFCNQFPVTKIKMQYKEWPKISEKFVENVITEPLITPSVIPLKCTLDSVPETLSHITEEDDLFKVK